MYRNIFLDRLKGLFAKSLAIINNIMAKDKNEKLSLYIIKSRIADDGESSIKKVTITLYFLSKTSKVFAKKTNKQVFKKEKNITEKYIARPVLSSTT
tara:strand:+ start:335 stop:625 length:291 start_codon:yes stop_codon:yes gene_type:complete